MFHTYSTLSAAPTVIHELSGSVDAQQAEQAAAEALLAVQAVYAVRGRIALLMDLRGVEFASLAAHRAWSLGFARNPALAAFVSRVAIVGADTPQFRLEQEALATDRVGFFTAVDAARAWLDEPSIAKPLT